MPVAAFTLPVEAASELVWRLLAESATQPQRFDSRVEAVRILPDAAGGLLREVKRGGIIRKERITLDPASGSLVATLVDDPEYTGSMTLRAEAGNPSSNGHRNPRVSARLDWQPLSGTEDRGAADALSADVQAQLLELKHAAESRAALASAT